MISADWTWIRRAWALALAVSALFVATTLFKTGGHPFLPLDDSFIYQRYARRLASGGWYSYSDGAGFTTGSTSPLWPWLLVPGHWAGLSGAKAVPLALAWGVATLLGSVAAIYELTKRLCHCLASVFAAALLCANGYGLYFYLSGMETGLYAFLLLASLVAAGRFEARPAKRTLGWLAAFLAILPLARPDGLFPAFLIGAWAFARRRDFAPGASEKSDGVAAKSIALALLVAALPFLAWQAIVWLATGTLETNGLQLKGLSSNPTATLGEKAAFVADALGAMATRFYANEFDYYYLRGVGALAHPPFLLPIALVGLIASAGARGERIGKPGLALLTLATIVVSVGATALNEFHQAHNHRYQAPAEPLLLAAYIAGLWRLCEVAARLFPAPALQEAERERLAARTPADYPQPGTEAWNRDRLFVAAALVALLVQASSLPWWADFYGENCADIRNQHRQMAWTLQDRVRPGDVLGITDAGAMPYFLPDTAFHDYAGLVTNNAAPWMRQGLGSVWESIERLPAERRPSLNVSYLEVFATPDGRHYLGTPLAESVLLRDTVTAGAKLIAFLPPWRPWSDAIDRGFAPAGSAPPPGAIHDPDLLKRADAPMTPLPEGARIVDSLDFADLESERARGFRFDHGAEPPAPQFQAVDKRNVFLLQGGETPIADGGRAIGGKASWRVVEPLETGKRYRLILRVSASWAWMEAGTAPGVGLSASGADGATDAGELWFDPSWRENEFAEVAWDFGASGDTKLMLRNLGPANVPSVFVAYHCFVAELP